MAWRTEEEIREGLLEIWQVMQACVGAACPREGILPGGLKVRGGRRLPPLPPGGSVEAASEGDPRPRSRWSGSPCTRWP